MFRVLVPSLFIVVYLFLLYCSFAFFYLCSVSACFCFLFSCSLLFGQLFLCCCVVFLGLCGDVVWPGVVWWFLLPFVADSWCVMFSEWGIRYLNVSIFRSISQSLKNRWGCCRPRWRINCPAQRYNTL